MKNVWVKYIVIIYSIIATIGLVVLAGKVADGKDTNELQKQIVLLEQDNKTLENQLDEVKDKNEQLEKENEKLQDKIDVLQDNKNFEDLLKDMEAEISELEENNKILIEKLSKLESDKLLLEKELNNLQQDYKLLEDEKNEIKITYNEVILKIVDILNMNPDIFEYDNLGLLSPQYALNAIEAHVNESMRYGHLQILLYEATGIHEPEEAIQHLINQNKDLE